MTLFLSLTRTSHTRILLSAEHEAKTVGSLGDHWRSSTESVWDRKGFGEGVKEVFVIVVRKIFEWMSPERRRAEVEAEPIGFAQSRA